LVKKSALPIFALLPEIRLDPAVNLCFSCFTFSMGMKKGYLPINKNLDLMNTDVLSRT
jgi:hypothetical protein